VRRFETPTAVNHGRTESKKDISMLGLRLISKRYGVTLIERDILSSVHDHPALWDGIFQVRS